MTETKKTKPPIEYVSRNRLMHGPQLVCFTNQNPGIFIDSATASFCAGYLTGMLMKRSVIESLAAPQPQAAEPVGAPGSRHRITVALNEELDLNSRGAPTWHRRSFTLC